MPKHDCGLKADYMVVDDLNDKDLNFKAGKKEYLNYLTCDIFKTIPKDKLTNNHNLKTNKMKTVESLKNAKPNLAQLAVNFPNAFQLFKEWQLSKNIHEVAKLMKLDQSSYPEDKLAQVLVFDAGSGLYDITNDCLCEFLYYQGFYAEPKNKLLNGSENVYFYKYSFNELSDMTTTPCKDEVAAFLNTLFIGFKCIEDVIKRTKELVEPLTASEKLVLVGLGLGISVKETEVEIDELDSLLED